MAKQLIAVHRLVDLHGKTWGFIKLSGDGTNEGITGFQLEACRGPLLGKFAPIVEGTIVDDDLSVAVHGLKD